jgi:hypothetical protein
VVTRDIGIDNNSADRYETKQAAAKPAPPSALRLAAAAREPDALCSVAYLHANERRETAADGTQYSAVDVTTTTRTALLQVARRLLLPRVTRWERDEVTPNEGVARVDLAHFSRAIYPIRDISARDPRASLRVASSPKQATGESETRFRFNCRRDKQTIKRQWPPALSLAIL